MFNKENHRAIKLAAGVIAMILVLVLAPRMDGPRLINGIRFTTKSGSPGLTNLGWLLLVSMPPIAYFIAGGILRLFSKKGE